MSIKIHYAEPAGFRIYCPHLYKKPLNRVSSFIASDGRGLLVSAWDRPSRHPSWEQARTSVPSWLKQLTKN